MIGQEDIAMIVTMHCVHNRQCSTSADQSAAAPALLYFSTWNSSISSNYVYHKAWTNVNSLEKGFADPLA